MRKHSSLRSAPGQKRRFDLLPATSGLRRTTDIIRPARWGPVRANKRPCMNRTGTNEAANRRNLSAQRFRSPWCVAGISVLRRRDLRQFDARAASASQGARAWGGRAPHAITTWLNSLG